MHIVAWLLASLFNCSPDTMAKNSLTDLFSTSIKNLWLVTDWQTDWLNYLPVNLPWFDILTIIDQPKYLMDSWLTDTFTDWLTSWLHLVNWIDLMTVLWSAGHNKTDWLTDWPNCIAEWPDWLTDSLTHFHSWVTDWLMDRLTRLADLTNWQATNNDVNDLIGWMEDLFTWVTDLISKDWSDCSWLAGWLTDWQISWNNWPNDLSD